MLCLLVATGQEDLQIESSQEHDRAGADMFDIPQSQQTGGDMPRFYLPGFTARYNILQPPPPYQVLTCPSTVP